MQFVERHETMRPYRIVVLLALCALMAASAWGQSSQGTISGIVLDSSQAAVPGADLTLTDATTNTERKVISDADGSYAFPNLIPGDYSLRVNAQGFRPYEQTRISIRVNQLVRLDVRMEVGAVTEVVTVSADASPLNFENATRQEGVSPEVINQLPLIVSGAVRNAANFAVLAPGVNTGGGEPEAFRSRINGGVQSGDEAIMDGVSMQQGTMSQTGMISFWDFPMTPDMVSEFKVLTSNYEPQYGASTSAQIMVETKAGTNQYHAGTYWYHRNTALNARQFGADARPKDLEHDFGFFVGGKFPGPLLNKDPLSTFVYFNYERFDVTGGVNRPTLSIPSLKQRNGDFTDWRDAEGNLIPIFDPATTRTGPDGTVQRDQFNCNGVANVICRDRFANSLANSWLSKLPDPTNNNPLNNYQLPRPVPDALISKSNYFIGRVDNYVGNKTHLYFSVWHQAAAPLFNTALDPSIADESFSDPQNSWVIRSNFDVTFSPTLVNHVAYGFLNRNEGYGSISLEPGASLPRISGVANDTNAPAIRFSDGYRGYGGTDGSNIGNKSTRPSHIFNDLLTWVNGSHTWKFGGEFRHIGQVFNSNTNEGGTFNFGRGATGLLNVNSGSPIASFLLGAVNDANVDFRTVNRWVAQARAYIFHVGDTWRISPKLTLNLGIRWDYFTPSWEEDNRLSFFDSEGSNIAAGGRKGRLAFAGDDAGEASFGKRYPEDGWKGGFAPRIGIAYALTPKTVVRTGYGVFFAQAFYPEWGGGMSLDGFNTNVSRNSTLGGLQPAFYLSQGFPALTAAETPPFINSGFRNGQGILYRPFEANHRSYSQQWNLTIEHQVGADSHISVAYVGNRGTRLPSHIAGINALNPSLLSMGDQLFDDFQPGQTSLHGVPVPYDGWVEQMQGCSPSVAQALLPYPQYCSGLYGLNENAGISAYHSFQTKYEQRFSGGTFVLASYTFSKLLTTSGHVDEIANTWSGLAGAISPHERERNYSLASDDVPHVFSLAFVQELPFGRGKRFANNGGVLNAIIGGWQVSGIVRASSGIPLFFRSGQCNIPGPFQMGYIPAITADSPFTAGKSEFLDNFDIPTSRLFTRDRFEPVSSFNFYGGSGPKVSNYRAFGYSNVDFTLVKTIVFAEKVRMQLRGEFFNIFNLHHLVGSGSGLRGSIFAFNNDPASPDFGTWNGSVTAPRNIQLGIRIEF